MKYKIFIICTLTGLFIPLLALVSCNSEPEKTEEVKLNANTITPKPGKTDPLKPGGLTDGLRKPDNPNGGATDPGGGATDPNGGAAAGNSGSGAANQQDEAEKQRIINTLINFMHQVIKDKINSHNNATWDEVGEDYNISGANQLFDVIQYTDAQKQQKLYNTQDDESKVARREMYLGLDYKKDYIKAFGALANKMVAAQNVQMKTELANMVDKIRQYARAFYFTAFNPLINKKDKLMELDLSDIETLGIKFQAIRSAYSNIFSKFVYSIYSDYDENIEIGTAKHTLQDNATAEEIQAYLNGKFTSNESYFDKIIMEATDIADILNKIQ
ncbi:virulence associated lipoprotein [Borrelia hermsii]|uniref:Lipoprotein n=2 Tax=Borrelia hermsii TaxID=140 RepID=A0AAN0X6F6_BORHE|nr:virulence associated lipoprotein [Borrelia hermsii]AMR75860.1 hypothetical protein A0V01_04420 [Borrelia hermsii]ANA43665.1 putative lipoprotein [Borrelia hermsii HS1]UCP01892.1 virulence associated lipoprotein [Borrelia hermsii]UPA08459.1 hypothetical protein bhDAH_001167 [Borrelia hermsii DAH]